MLLQHQLDELKKEIALMARKAEDIYEKANDVLFNRNLDAIAEVRDMDKVIDDYEIKLDEKLIQILALQEPYAVDFRYIFSCVKTVVNLERIGDQSKVIAKWTKKLTTEPTGDMRELSKKTGEALSRCVEALINGDVEQANEVMKLEFEVDAIEDRIIETSTSVAEAFIAKAFERIGDLATNIAESVIYYVNAEDIRHGGFKDSAG